jgi:hypothetical protein
MKTTEMDFIPVRKPSMQKRVYGGRVVTQHPRGFMDERDVGYALLLCAIFGIHTDLEKRRGRNKASAEERFI